MLSLSNSVLQKFPEHPSKIARDVTRNLPISAAHQLLPPKRPEPRIVLIKNNRKVAPTAFTIAATGPPTWTPSCGRSQLSHQQVQERAIYTWLRLKTVQICSHRKSRLLDRVINIAQTSVRHRAAVWGGSGERKELRISSRPAECLSRAGGFYRRGRRY